MWYSVQLVLVDIEWDRIQETNNEYWKANPFECRWSVTSDSRTYI